MGKYMTEKLGMAAKLPQDDVRTLVGVYYSMRQVGFSKTITFTLADDISMDLIAYIKEHHGEYPGVEVQSEAVRQYDTTAAAHVLGTVGVVDATEWKDTYKELAGYQMTSVVGKTGLEKAFESYLHGSSGSRTVETDLGGNEVAEQSTTAPRPGDNVVTTLDLDLQEVAERSLAENLAGNGRGGAAVALDPNTGEVLAMASYPTYSLADYNSTAAAEDRASDSRHPEVNRATSGVYPPGSTFKVLSAIAGLEEGIIDANTQINCTGVFEYGGQKFTCKNHDTPMTLDVTRRAQVFVQHVFLYRRSEADRRASGKVVRAVRPRRRHRHRHRRALRPRRRPDLPRGNEKGRPLHARLAGRRRCYRGDRPVGQRLYAAAAGKLYLCGRQRRNALSADARAEPSRATTFRA